MRQDTADRGASSPASLAGRRRIQPAMRPRKSVLLALVLTFFFGPFGMLYSTVPGAIVMLVLYVALGIPTLGWALAVLHPIAMVWGAWAAHRANGGI